MFRVFAVSFLLCIFAFGAVVTNAGAQESAKISKKANTSKKSKTPAVEQEEDESLPCPPVPAAIKEKNFVQPAPFDSSAKLFFIYQSRSTCGICVHEIPEILEIYKTMKGQGAEIVMLNIDSSRSKAEEWIKKARITFPVVAPEERQGIPFPYEWKGATLLPIMVAVDAQGNKLGQANGKDVPNFLKTWRLLMPRQEEGNLIPKLLKEKSFATSAKVHPKARLFFVMRMPSVSNEINTILKTYSSMKGRGAEIIMLHTDRNKSAIASWAKKQKIKFPILAAADALDVPFPHSGSNQQLGVVAMDASGQVLRDASGADAVTLLIDWKNILREMDKRSEAQQDTQESTAD